MTEKFQFHSQMIQVVVVFRLTQLDHHPKTDTITLPLTAVLMFLIGQSPVKCNP